MSDWPIPKTPVLGWDAFHGRHDADTPCLLDLPGLVYTTSGRAAILLALEALGAGPDDEVLLPTYHCPTMVAPVTMRKAKPVFYPIDASGAPRLDWIESHGATRCKVMLVAHLFGLPQPMRKLRQWCNDQGISLIEDCAHALLGRSDGRPVGSWGDVAIASLTKFLPLPDGGCLVLNGRLNPPALQAAGLISSVRTALDVIELGAIHGHLPGLNRLIPSLVAQARRLRRHGTPAAAQSKRGAAGTDATDLIDQRKAHMAFSASGAWLARRLPRRRIAAARRQNYAQLSRMLSGQVGLHPLFPSLPPDCAPYVFPLWVDEPDPGYLELRRRGMPVFRWNWRWPDVPHLDADQGPLWTHHVLQLACHQDLRDSELQSLAGSVREVYGQPQAPTTAVQESTAPIESTS